MKPPGSGHGFAERFRHNPAYSKVVGVFLGTGFPSGTGKVRLRCVSSSSDSRIMPRADCPTPELLEEYLSGALPFSEARRWDAHFLQCAACAERAQQWEQQTTHNGPHGSVTRELNAVAERVEPAMREFVGRHNPHFAPLVPGDTLGEYRLLSKLGQGGMGVVYRATHLQTGAEVAIKVLLPRAIDSAEALRRFQREADAISQLDHPGFVRAIQTGAEAQLAFLVMEYVEGQNLLQLVREQGSLPARQAVELVMQAASSMQHAHDRGILHRDLKPQNLIVDAAGNLKIADLGLVRVQQGTHSSQSLMTNPELVIGTAEFLSPEQALDSQEASAQSDIYSLGCTLYFLLTGRPIYEQPTTMKILIAHREAPIPTLGGSVPEIPARLERVFQRMVAKSPAARQLSMAAVVDEMQSVFTSEPADPAPPTLQPKTSRWRRLFVFTAAVAGLLVAMLVPAMLKNKALSPDTDHPSRGNPAVSTASRPETPPFAIAPFDSASAGQHQREWASYLNGPLEIQDSQSLRLTLIPPGEFQMGMTEADVTLALQVDAESGQHAIEANYQYLPFVRASRDYFAISTPQHPVRISKPFYLGTYEVSRGQFRKFVKETGYQTEAEKELQAQATLDPRDYRPKGTYQLANWSFSHVCAPDDDCAVGYISWNDASAFCRWLSQKEGVTYRLPTEAEWEYACRAGTTTLWWNGNDLASLAKIGNYADGIDEKFAPANGRARQYSGNPGLYFADGYLFAAPIGSYSPNSFGLFEMYGNAAEWCQDQYDKNQLGSAKAVDPQGPTSGTDRISRGGGWASRARQTFSAHRDWFSPNHHYADLGFRVVREIPSISQGSLAGTTPAEPLPRRLERDPIPPEQNRSEPPVPSGVPFTASSARQYQLAWAEHLGVSPEVSTWNRLLLRLIPPGSFRAGLNPANARRQQALLKKLQDESVDAQGRLSPLTFKQDESHDSSASPVVTIRRPFYLSDREVSLGQFRLFVVEDNYKTDAERELLAGGLEETWSHPSFSRRELNGRQLETHPVVNVSYNDAIKFCEWLSRREKRACRLPTEAEWEYACRAGSDALWSHGDDLNSLKDFANTADAVLASRAPLINRIAQVSGTPGFYFPDGYLTTAPAGLFFPNAFGLHDMHGNVREWCADEYNASGINSTPDSARRPSSPETKRVLRGGSWWNSPLESNSAWRASAPAKFHSPYIGFRVVFEIPEKLSGTAN